MTKEKIEQEKIDSLSNELIVVARNIIDKNFPKEKSKSRGMALLTSALLTMEFAKYIAENYIKKPQ